jgi:hypothetical protein
VLSWFSGSESAGMMGGLLRNALLQILSEDLQAFQSSASISTPVPVIVHS